MLLRSARWRTTSMLQLVHVGLFVEAHGSLPYWCEWTETFMQQVRAAARCDA